MINVMNPREINICPSLLSEGHSTYSIAALKELFNGKTVSHILNFESPSGNNSHLAIKNVGRLSLSEPNRNLDSYLATMENFVILKIMSKVCIF